MSEKPVELKQFIKRRRNGQNQRVGVMYAQTLPDGSGTIAIGFSLCSKDDEFCPIDGEDRAFNRSLAYLERPPYFKKEIDTSVSLDGLAPFIEVKGVCLRTTGNDVVEVRKNLIPDSIKTDFAVFIGRAERFFKGFALPEWAKEYYADHTECVEKFFVKLAAKKARIIEKEQVEAAYKAITKTEESA